MLRAASLVPLFRPLRSGSPSRRHLHSTFRTLRNSGNVLARYAAPPKNSAYPVLPQTVAELPSAGTSNGGDAFRTAATAPVGTSFQETPPPSSEARTKLAVQLPAMKPLAEEQVVKTVPPAEREIRVEGVLIPAKPVPPGEEECCMSGCVHCVYTIYADDLEVYTAALSEARQAVVKSKRPLSDWPEVVRSMEEDGKSAGQVKEEAKADVVAGMDPTLAAFFALENKLKKRQAPDASTAT